MKSNTIATLLTFCLFAQILGSQDVSNFRDLLYMNNNGEVLEFSISHLLCS